MLLLCVLEELRAFASMEPTRLLIREITNQRCFLSMSYPQPIPPDAGGRDTHGRPLDPFSGAGHGNLRASV